MEAFAIRDLSFTYPEQSRPALRGLSLAVPQGAFLVLCGPSGCGKSTLLRQLKPALTPHGVRTGEILFEGAPLAELDRRAQSQRIGFVQQSPENQVVTDKVWHELAFGPESLGWDTPAIRRRVAEMASFFGIQSWFDQDVSDLSGGQKQLLNLAAVMVLQPSVLILDEPTSRLDPIAASDFLGMLGRINRELGTTILLTEHRLEEVFPLATDLAVMEEGRILTTGSPSEVGQTLRERGHAMFLAMPTAMRVWAAVESGAPCPVTVREGRDWLEDFAAGHPLAPLPSEPARERTGETAIEAEKLWFKYERDRPDVVKGLSLSVKRGEFLALLGGNGTGKTTTLKLLAGLLKPYRGTVGLSGSVGVLPQEPQTLFVKKTVREDLYEMVRGTSLSRELQDGRIAQVTALCRLEELLDRHPYDLSGGEQQRLALAKILLPDPDILLLDEPTKGLDAEFKQSFAGILARLLDRGVTVLMVSHDIEFCARYAHRCALFFDGSIVAEAPPRAFFSGNSFYTTSANRMARGVLPGAVTAEDVIAACGGKLPPAAEVPPAPEPPGEDGPPPTPEETKAADRAERPLPWWRKLGAAVFGGLSFLLFLSFQGRSGRKLWNDLLGGMGVLAAAGGQPWPVYALFLASLLAFAFCVTRRSRRGGEEARPPREKRKLTRRTLVAVGLILLLIPLTLLVGETYLDGKKYYVISLLVLLECMLPFFLVFEGRKPQARELVIIAVLCAVSVAGRAAFFMLPQFKPVMAMTIIAGVAFGGETGFLVGAVTMLASNILFAQGPWTPWQMFAMGITGFLAGVLFRKGFLRRSRAALCVFGALAAIGIYGVLLNVSSALMAGSELNGRVLLAYCLSGFPFDCVHAAATWLFLWFAAEPMLEKLDRVKVKYGLVQ